MKKSRIFLKLKRDIFCEKLNIKKIIVKQYRKKLNIYREQKENQVVQFLLIEKYHFENK